MEKIFVNSFFGALIGGIIGIISCFPAINRADETAAGIGAFIACTLLGALAAPIFIYFLSKENDAPFGLEKIDYISWAIGGAIYGGLFNFMLCNFSCASNPMRMERNFESWFIGLIFFTGVGIICGLFFGKCTNDDIERLQDEQVKRQQQEAEELQKKLEFDKWKKQIENEIDDIFK